MQMSNRNIVTLYDVIIVTYVIYFFPYYSSKNKIITICEFLFIIKQNLIEEIKKIVYTVYFKNLYGT